MDGTRAGLKDEVDGWRSIARSVDDSAGTIEGHLGERRGSIDDAVYQIDDLLAEDHWTAVVDQLDVVEGALRDVDGELVTLSVLGSLQRLSGDDEVLAGFDGDIADAYRALTVPWRLVRCADRPQLEVEALDGDEYVDWLDDRRRESADGVRAEAGAVAEGLAAAIESARQGDTFVAFRELAAGRGALVRAHQAYDAWSVTLGAISNIAPDLLGAAASGGL